MVNDLMVMERKWENNENREKSFRDGRNRGKKNSLNLKLSEDRWF
jgi:hypothetical protein